MSFEQQLEDFLVKVFKRAIVEGLQSLPLQQVPAADPGPAPEKRSRKKADAPKEVAPQPEFTAAPTEAQDAPAVAAEPSPAVAPPAVVEQPASAASSGVDVALPEVERRHVSAALITVAQNPEHGPSVAYGILTNLGVKDVSGLKPAQYIEVVAAVAKILGKPVIEVLSLEPKKV